MKNVGYKITITGLILIIVFQWMFMESMKPAKRIVKKPIQKPGAVVTQGKIAIVLDDWGYNLNNLSIVDKINFPFTASILPNLSYSRAVADELHNRGFEIILHLPMEPHEKYRLEKNTIFSSLDGQSIKRIIGLDLDSINYAVGVSNHMGSAVTEDAKVLGIVFKELKSRNMFFLDSFVTPKSVCFELSQKMGLGFISRDVFLDNVEESNYIKQQISKLKAKAKAKGYAVGIGHDRKITLQVLKEVMPQLKKEGFKLVFLSELVK